MSATRQGQPGSGAESDQPSKVPPFRFMPLDERLVGAITTWWDDAETAKRVGGYLPAQAWELASNPPGEFRGKRVLGRIALVAMSGGEPIAMTDFERYSDGTAGLGLVVAPKWRNQGVGRRVLSHLAASDHVAEVKSLVAGIEPDNIASVKCFLAAGFQPASAEPDEEGIIYYELDLGRTNE